MDDGKFLQVLRRSPNHVHVLSRCQRSLTLLAVSSSLLAASSSDSTLLLHSPPMAPGKKKSSKETPPSNSASHQTRSSARSGAKSTTKVVSTSKWRPLYVFWGFTNIPFLLETSKSSKRKTPDAPPEGSAKRPRKGVQEPVDGASDGEHLTAPAEQGMFYYISTFYYYSNILQQYLKWLRRPSQLDGKPLPGRVSSLSPRANKAATPAPARRVESPLWTVTARAQMRAPRLRQTFGKR
jgi:hypothetical protein